MDGVKFYIRFYTYHGSYEGRHFEKNACQMYALESVNAEEILRLHLDRRDITDCRKVEELPILTSDDFLRAKMENLQRENPDMKIESKPKVVLDSDIRIFKISADCSTLFVRSDTNSAAIECAKRFNDIFLHGSRAEEFTISNVLTIDGEQLRIEENKELERQCIRKEILEIERRKRGYIAEISKCDEEIAKRRSRLNML